MNKGFIQSLVILLLISCCKKSPHESIPRIDGSWWQLTNTYPDISPYSYSPGDNKVCDFTIFQARDSSWQLVACIRGNDYPGAGRFLYRWQARSLNDTMWKEKGFFLTTGGKDKVDKQGNLMDTNFFKVEGRLQAPHAFTHSGSYYLFYNNDDAHCMKSDDGLNWEQIKNNQGNPQFFKMGRDVMIFDDTKNKRWIAYYTSGEKYPQYMAARTCDSITGSWSEEKMIYDGYSNTRNPIYRNEFAESPFVIEKENIFYLFAQFHVFVSKDPLHFNPNDKIANLESSVYEQRAWAPEIIKDALGQLYIAAYRTDGIWMAKLKFAK